MQIHAKTLIPVVLDFLTTFIGEEEAQEFAKICDTTMEKAGENPLVKAGGFNALLKAYLKQNPLMKEKLSKTEEDSSSDEESDTKEEEQPKAAAKLNGKAKEESSSDESSSEEEQVKKPAKKPAKKVKQPVKESESSSDDSSEEEEGKGVSYYIIQSFLSLSSLGIYSQAA